MAVNQYVDARTRSPEVGDIIDFISTDISTMSGYMRFLPDKRFLITSIKTIREYDDGYDGVYDNSGDDEMYSDEEGVSILGEDPMTFTVVAKPYILDFSEFGSEVTYYPVENKYFARVYDDRGRFLPETEVIFYPRPQLRNRSPEENRRITEFLRNYIKEWKDTLTPEEISRRETNGYEYPVEPRDWINLINDNLINEYVDTVESWDERLDYIQDDADIMYYDIDFDVDDPRNRKILYFLSSLNTRYGRPFLSFGILDEFIDGFKASRHFANEYIKVKSEYMGLLQPAIKAARS